MKKALIIHPFLLTLFFTLFLFAHNITDVLPQDMIRPLLLSLGGAVFLLIFFKYLFKDWELAGIACSLFLIFFFSYGHVYSGVVHPLAKGLFQLLVGQGVLMPLVWMALFAVAIYVVLRLRSYKDFLTQFFNILAAVLLVNSIYIIVSYEIKLRLSWENEVLNSLTHAQTQLAVDPNDRDIYYIILDGYARQDILESYYNYDNSALIDFLRQKGFYVADRARPNYMQTTLSLASSLNMIYLDVLSETYGASSDRVAAVRLIRSNSVQQYLEERGYQTFGFVSDFRASKLGLADHLLQPPQTTTSMLERLLIETSALTLVSNLPDQGWSDLKHPAYETHRRAINYIFDHLGEIARQPGPKFVFAHVVAPHPPFVFDAQGQPTAPSYPFTFMDGNAFPGTQEEYRQGYRSQIEYINRQVMQAVEDILANSVKDPIIIIQGDHGPGSQFDWIEPGSVGLVERLAILNAYYLPGDATDSLYPEISPVNTFRVILRDYFGENLPLLTDKSYYSAWEKPYIFIEVKPDGTEVE